jgi:hypothetical protein
VTDDEIAAYLGCDDLKVGESRKVSAPYRDDPNPSLNVTRTKDKFLFKDHGYDDNTFEALSGYFETNGHRSDWPNIEVRSGKQEGQQEPDATYDYVGKDGRLRFQVCRVGHGNGKRFFQRRPAGKDDGQDGWINGLGKTKPILYRLPEVLAAVERGDEIFIPEGEKDVDAIFAAGGVATCNPMGAGKWRDEYSENLRGARVVVVADRDKPGQKHARDVKRSLIGVASSVRVVEALTGKDASDHLDAGHTLDEFMPADRFPRMDLGAVIEGGIPDPEFVVADVIYEGRAHALMGEPGDGKTLVMLGFAVQVMKVGLTVAWFDEENGPTVIAARLVALGAAADEVREYFAYYPYTEPTLADADDLAEEMAMLEPALVVFDSGADMYVASGLNENDNMDMTEWARAFSQRLSRALGIASVVLEHVTKKGDDSYQRGAGAKKAKVDASWRLEVLSPFDHETVGEVELTRKKDRLAHLPSALRYRIGGNGSGTTVFERIPIEDEEAHIAEDQKRKREAFRSEAVKVLRREGATTREKGLTQTVLTGLLSPATQTYKNELVQHLASNPITPVRNARGTRNSLVYWLDEEENDD